MLLIDHEQPLQFWEYPCPATGCDRLYRFTKRDGWLSWEPIIGFTEPTLARPPGQPVETTAVIERLLREARSAA